MVNCFELQKLPVVLAAGPGPVAGRLAVERLVADPCGIEAAGLRGTEAGLAWTGSASRLREQIDFTCFYYWKQ